MSLCYSFILYLWVEMRMPIESSKQTAAPGTPSTLNLPLLHTTHPEATPPVPEPVQELDNPPIKPR